MWATPNGYNVLTGSLAYYPGRFAAIIGLTRPSAFLDGNVVAYDHNGNVLPDMGPGHVSGTGTKPWVAIGSL
jgi:hypothetical protein